MYVYMLYIHVSDTMADRVKVKIAQTKVMLYRSNPFIGGSSEDSGTIPGGTQEEVGRRWVGLLSSYRLLGTPHVHLRSGNQIA